MIMNRKAREEWEKKQAETEKLRKANEVGAVYVFCDTICSFIKLSIKYKRTKKNAQACTYRISVGSVYDTYV